MPVLVHCSCGEVFTCPENPADRQIACPVCRKQYVVGRLDSPPGTGAAESSAVVSSEDNLLPDLDSLKLEPEEAPVPREMEEELGGGTYPVRASESVAGVASVAGETEKAFEHQTAYRVHEAEGVVGVAGVTGVVGHLRLRRDAPAQCLAFAANQRAALAAVGETVFVLDVRWQQKTGQFAGHRAPVTSLAFVSGDQVAFSGDAEGQLLFWETSTGKVIQRLPAHRGAVLALAVSPSGRFAVSGGEDGQVRLWDLPAAQDIPLSQARWQARVTCVAFAPHGRLFLAGSDHGLLYLWSAQTGEVRQRLLSGYPNDSACFSADGSTVVAGSREGQEVGRWTVLSGTLRQTFALSPETLVLRDLVVAPGGEHVVTVAISHENIGDFHQEMRSSLNQVLHYWNATTGQQVHAFAYGPQRHVSLAVAAAGNRALSASEDGSVRVWGL